MPDRPLNSIQGNILKSFARGHARYLMLRFAGKSDRKTRARLSEILIKNEYVTSAWSQAEMTEKWRRGASSEPVGMFGLAQTGYDHLGLGSRAPIRIDLGANLFHATLRQPWYSAEQRVDRWEQQYVKGIDAFLLLADDDSGRLEEAAERARRELDGVANVAIEECGSRMFRDNAGRREEIEHFGYRDGISRTVDPEILLSPETEAPESGLGCFAVFMKIEQHVDRFKDQVNEFWSASATTHAPAAPNDIRARIVGRYPEGKPLAEIKGGLDDFDFRDDPEGGRCPIQSHIRVMNPRDGELPIPVVRRGISYGPSQSGESKPGARGLLFLSLHRCLTDFVHLMTRALRKRDPILSDSSLWEDTPTETTHCTHGVRAQTWKIEGREVCYPFADVTTLRGGEFFYIPSMDFIGALGSMPDGGSASSKQPG